MVFLYLEGDSRGQKQHGYHGGNSTKNCERSHRSRIDAPDPKARLLSADAIEAALQFAGILAANLFAMGTYPVAELGSSKRGRFDVEQLLHQAFDLIARIDHISSHPAEHADALKSEP